MERYNNVTSIAKSLMNLHVKENSIVLDATMGNGNDTQILASLVSNEGKVYAFDIQDTAIIKTRQKLEDQDLLNNVELIKDSHENIDVYINENIDFAIYNLGYLPSGDHSIITRPDSTICSLKKCIEKLNKQGVIVLSIYYGHEGGMDEKNAVIEFLSSLPQKEYNVGKVDFINQANNPPLLIFVEKR